MAITIALLFAINPAIPLVFAVGGAFNLTFVIVFDSLDDIALIVGDFL
ncbi:hypothetical protein ACPDXT_001797 [Vibrio cholerae]